VKQTQASQPPTRASDANVQAAPEHRRRTSRQARHEARARLRGMPGDEEALEDADLVCPQPPHDLGRKASPPPHHEPKPGRRKGFKVWKTPYWKRRRAIWAAQNAEARRLAKEE
jgi:hypothetical protein